MLIHYNKKYDCYDAMEHDLKFGKDIILDGVKLIPISVLKDIRTEIDKLQGINSAYYIAIEDAKEVIDKYITKIQ